jgi:DNA mismatch repair protein MutS2
VEVITPPDGQGLVEVLVGTMRAKIPVYQLERPAESHQAAAQHQVFFSRPTGRRIATEIDVRGLRADEALVQVEGLLNDVALDGLRSARIIHGKGTGALRLAVRNYLHGHPLVTAAAPAEGPGGEGVTVVELK